MENYLTFIKNVGKDKSGKTIGLYICKCGVEKEILNSNVNSGKTKSCGCYHKSLRPTLTHGLSNHPLFRVWNSMIERCYKPYNKQYKNYGAKGVKVCDEWLNDFLSFYNWCIATGWQKGLQVDKDIIAKRLGVKPDLYSPQRCSLVSSRSNCNSKINNTYVTYNGESKTYGEWAYQYNLPAPTLRKRILNGWNLKDALTYPVGSKGGSIKERRYTRGVDIKYSFGYIN